MMIQYGVDWKRFQTILKKKKKSNQKLKYAKFAWKKNGQDEMKLN